QIDLDVATEVAKFLNIDHKIFEVNNIPSDDSISEQFNHKKGLNSIRMSFIIPFFKELRKVYGAHSFNFTGDGGDKMLVDLSPLYPIHTEDELVDYILKYNTRYHDVRKVCDIFNLPIGSLKEQIREIITGYPEKSIHNKYVHFIIYERAFKWLYEGEDRNRAYFWSTSPFYSVHFFKLAMQVSSRKKASYKLYRNFLFAISPGVARLKNANWNRRLNLNNIVYVHWLLELLRKYPAVKKYIKRNVKPQHTADAEFHFAFNYLRRKIDSNRRIYEHVIVIEKLETLLQNKEELSKPFIYDMSTIFQVLLDIKERE
ncbi:MAG: hypothetical protein ACOC2C_04475, partial [Cyclonatronaceae bacterium]